MVYLREAKNKKQKIIFLKQVLFSIFYFLFLFRSEAQDPHFTQFYNQPLYVNPAFAGINDGIKVGALYRNLWTKVPSKFNTFNVAAEMQNLNIGGGLGFIAGSDVEGEGFLRTLNFGAIYQYRIIIDPRNFIIQAGIQTSFFTQSIDWNKLVFSDQLDAVQGLVNPTTTSATPPPISSKSFVDFDGGALARFNLKHHHRKSTVATGTLGFAVHHMAQPEQSLLNENARLPYKLSVHGGLVIPYKIPGSNSKNVIAPSFLYEKQDLFQETIFGLNVMKEPFYAGVWYRNRNAPFAKNTDAIIANLGFMTKYDKNSEIRFGYAYDITINNLRGFAPGTNEITISISYGEKHAHGNKKKQECYTF